MRIIRPCKVVFADENIEKEYLKLDSNSEIKKNIDKAKEEIKKNAFCAIPIPKRLIPKVYVQKYGIKNLWKYDLPDGWRLIYSITTPNKVEIISVILEWFNHPYYEKRFGY